MDYLNIGLAFLEGLALIISPCILPILPIILSGSLDSSKKRPLGIVFGFVLTFAIFTYFSRALVLHTGINLTVVRYFSYGLLILFGIVMLSTYLTEKFTLTTQRLTRTGSSFSAVNDAQGGFGSGLLLGCLVGIIWTPCAGPILAAVIVQSVLQQTTLSSFFVILAFGLGAAVPMLVIVFFGRKMMEKFSFFKTHAYLIRKILGAIIIVSVAYMIYGESVPTASAKSSLESSSQLMNWLSEPYPAPEITGITAWINSPPLQMGDLKGKVVLIDFWAYSCINCIRTLPYLKDWYQKYHDKGLVIIGIHAPEFEFERDLSNVKNAVEKFGIKYPVALDNNFATWKNYNNQYWPAHYLIDKNGDVVYTHFGEGDYETTENNIRRLLGVTGANTQVQPESVASKQTRETYLGSSRAANYSSPESITANKPFLYSYPKTLDDDYWALSGLWAVASEKIVSAQADAALKIHFNAGKIFVVMGNATSQPIKVKLLLNGEQVVKEKGKDVVDSSIVVSGHRLYEAVVMKSSSNGVLQIIASAPGLEVYTFTFGS
jgi:cytochrome c biogenesis protein CcdA/peroxiredoxin